jgi:hypothetical protein
MSWLAEIPLSEPAAAVRRRLGVRDWQFIEHSVENLALISTRPVSEIAERLLVSVEEMSIGDGTDSFERLLGDVLDDPME